MLVAFGVLVGVLVALLVQPSVPQDLSRYVAMAVVAAIDAGFGGVRAALERTFNDRIFVAAFVLNGLLAAGLVWLGDQLGVDFATAVVVVFGVRIFQNLAAIRRRVLGGMTAPVGHRADGPSRLLSAGRRAGVLPAALVAGLAALAGYLLV